MFFFLSKLVDTLILPSNIMVALGALATLLLLVGWRRLGYVAGALALAIPLAAGFTPLGNLPVAVLEDRFPVPDLTEPPTGVVMLGGAVDLHLSVTRGQVILNDAAERVTETAALANRFPTMRVFLSGGWSSDTDKGRVSESSFARQALIGMGVAPERIEMEENSRTTFENAVETRKAIEPKPGERWLLLTSASHMPRSVAVFREQGLDLVPYPVDYRTRGLAHPLNRPRSTAVGLTNLDLAAHEWIGLVGYWLSGRTKTLMPAR
ncbi:YdcF family protein [Rhizobium sp. TRM95796]|uniref:YdcF family protein n=1 Tax=Rhizobium sp. TRM95796 TaxID=2979862 RepID=UPI0021E7E9D2|nr:YdcF family protein [Rhizobium sp. TRM95796]MCV3764502.1 YdcF family protein [Rhizobium sp. TRM95796]